LSELRKKGKGVVFMKHRVYWFDTSGQVVRASYVWTVLPQCIWLVSTKVFSEKLRL